MKKFDIWYMKPEYFRDGSSGKMPDVSDLGRTHVELKTVEAYGIDAAFAAMQGDVWSPNGEARGLIDSKGLHHTSMSVGDVAVDERGDVHVVAFFGWRRAGNIKRVRRS